MRYLIASLLIGAAFLLGCVHVERHSARAVSLKDKNTREEHSTAEVSSTTDEHASLKEREEIHQTYQLQPGAHVQIGGINGAVRIETVDNQTAEVSILRTAASKATLEDHQIVIKQNPTSLSIYSEHKQDNFVGRLLRHLSPDIREEVTLKLPRRVELSTGGINGSVTVGEVQGSVNLEGINGTVTVAQSAGEVGIDGVNGKVVMMIGEMDNASSHLEGINGPIELNFAADANAELEGDGVNGPVDSTSPDISIQKEEHNPSSFHAQIGKGGPGISLSGINGPIRLTRATSTAKVEQSAVVRKHVQ